MKEYVITINGEVIRTVTDQELQENAKKFGKQHGKKLMKIRKKRPKSFSNILRWLNPF